MATIPTVKVIFGDGYRVINESDYDPDVHELYEEGKVEKEEAPIEEIEEEEPEEVTEDRELETEHVGHGWYVARVDGETLMKDDGETPIKFKGEAAAEAALEAYLEGGE